MTLNHFSMCIASILPCGGPAWRVATPYTGGVSGMPRPTQPYLLLLRLCTSIASANAA